MSFIVEICQSLNFLSSKEKRLIPHGWSVGSKRQSGKQRLIDGPCGQAAGNQSRNGGGKNLHALKCIKLILGMIVICFGMHAHAFEEDPVYRTTMVILVKKNKEEYRFFVSVAETTKQMHKGLMGRRAIALDSGILFVPLHPTIMTMWMKNTLIPLDILFVGEKGKILHIHPNAQPNDETPITYPEPVVGVLEISGGLTDRLGIKVGDQVISAPLH